MSFADTVAPLSANTQQGADPLGQGLTIPILKAMNHLSVVLTWDESDTGVTREYLDSEVLEACQHLQRIIRPPFPSQALLAKLDVLETVRRDLQTDYTQWSDDDLRTNLTTLVTGLAGLLQTIDFELAGITTASAGSSI